MFSKVLSKLVDQAIVPALVLVVVRLLSVVLVSNYLKIPVFLEYTGFVFKNPSDYIIVNSYSTFIVMLTLVLGIVYVLLKSLLFHDSHITPGLTAKLFSTRLSYLIQSSLDLYSQASVWLSYLYLVTVVSGIMYMFETSYAWVFVAGIVFSVIVTYIFIIDIERELEIHKANAANKDMEVEVYEF